MRIQIFSHTGKDAYIFISLLIELYFKMPLFFADVL